MNSEIQNLIPYSVTFKGPFQPELFYDFMFRNLCFFPTAFPILTAIETKANIKKSQNWNNFLRTI